MLWLRRWMRIVGGFYIVMGIFNTPLIIEARLPAQYPDLGVTTDSVAARALIDTWFMFGLEVLVIGVALIYFSSDPARHIALVWTVLGLELIRGVFDDLYLIARGHDVMIYSGWILIHLIIIGTGILALRALSSTASDQGSTAV